MPPLGLVVRVLGLAGVSIPLSTILPQGTAGCSLLARADLLDVYLPSSGSVTLSLVIPNTLALATQNLWQQVVPVELDAVGNITAWTSSNALSLTIGAF
ncbi:MAG TPA: hypothetical protein VFZ65_22170, partial [Planctomycetota bacterium]|nr:hypothetical protein [Planctomycetota bacterium]